MRASLPEALQEWVDSSTGVNTDDLFGANDMVPAGVDPVRDATLAVVAQLLEKVSSQLLKLLWRRCNVAVPLTTHFLLHCWLKSKREHRAPAWLLMIRKPR